MSFHINPVTHNAQECDSPYGSCKVTTLHARNRDEAFLIWRYAEYRFKQNTESGFAFLDAEDIRPVRIRKEREVDYAYELWNTYERQMTSLVATGSTATARRARLQAYLDRAWDLIQESRKPLSALNTRLELLAHDGAVVLEDRGWYQKMSDGSYRIGLNDPCPSCGRDVDEAEVESKGSQTTGHYVRTGSNWRCWE